MTRYPKIARNFERKDIVGNFSATDDATGTFTGYLSTFGGPPDRQGDVVLKGAFRQTIKDAVARRSQNNLDYLWPLLYGHSFESLPIGGIISAVEDSHGLLIRAKLATETSMGHDVYVLAKQKMLTSMSIGYKTIHSQWHKDASGQAIRELTEIQLIEGSITEIPANENARILSVKAGGYSMPGKSFETDYQQAQCEDWCWDDFSTLTSALRSSLINLFMTSDNPSADLQSQVLAAFSSALIAYVAEGVALGVGDYLSEQQNSSGMDMMSASGAYDEKAGRTLSARTRAALSTIANGITSHVQSIQSTVEKERAAALQGFPLYSASARPELSRKAMMESSHTAIGAATSGIMTHVRSLKSMAYEARRQNDLRGWPIVRSRSSADLDLEEKTLIRELTASLRETTESMERDRDPAVQHLRDLRESLPSSRAGGPTTQQRLESMQASLSVDLAMRALLESEKD